MTTATMLRKTVKAVCEEICDTPGSAPALTESLLRLVQASNTHENQLASGSAEAVGMIHELQRQVKQLSERCNMLEMVANVKRLEQRG